MQVVQHLAVFNSSRDPLKNLGGVGNAASGGCVEVALHVLLYECLYFTGSLLSHCRSFNSWDPDCVGEQSSVKCTQHSLLQDTICVRFARVVGAGVSGEMKGER